MSPERILIAVMRSDACVPRRRALASLTSAVKCCLVFAVLAAGKLLACINCCSLASWRSADASQGVDRMAEDLLSGGQAKASQNMRKKLEKTETKRRETWWQNDTNVSQLAC